MTKLTDASIANKSGTILEEKLELFLKQNNVAYKRQRSGHNEIDFIIHLNEDKTIYADCTNQNVLGSVEEKIPHKVWKYFKKYNYKEVYIIKGKYNISKSVIEHLKEDEKLRGYITQIVSFEEFCAVINDCSLEKIYLERFMR